MSLDNARLDAVLDSAKRGSFWLDTPDRPTARPALTGDDRADLVIVGGGFVGLWTAVRAKERNPDRSVLLIEGDRIAEYAAGRNGGFCEASITHGAHNGQERWPEDFDQLQRLGQENLEAIAATVQRYGIECDFLHTGTLSVATRAHEVAYMGPGTEGYLDADAVRELVNSPTYLAGRWNKSDSAMVDPARLAWGLADAAESLGVRIAEGVRVDDLQRIRGRRPEVVLQTSHGRVRAGRVVLATSASRPLLRRLRWHTVPVYDYVLMTEPLTADQLASIGWTGRHGISDSGNQFHYYRLTADNRILWGGYDAIYHYGRTTHDSLEDRRATQRALARNFYATFPQLSDVGFSHRWGGVIDTCTRFCAFFGTAFGHRVTYALGFTGLGVGASRFAADTMLDLLDRSPTERTTLGMVRRRPVPFPPEPLAYVGVQVTRWSLARADTTGRRNLWLRTLDRLGLGFDS